MKEQTKRICILLAFYVLLALTGMGCEMSEVPEASKSIKAGEWEEVPYIDSFLVPSSDRQFGDYSIEDIRQILSRGEQLYQNFRVYNDTEGTAYYRVPVQGDEANYLLEQAQNYMSGKSQSDIRSYNTTQSRAVTVPHTIIMGEHRNNADSIVIVLMGDAFTAAQYIDNGVEGIALTHARAVMKTMLDTHPFSLFADLFKVYVIHVASPKVGVDGILGTVLPNGNLVASDNASSL